VKNTFRSTAAVLLALASGATARAEIVDRLDQPAPEIVASTWWNGAAPKMANLRGKVVILHVSDPSRATSKGFLPNLVKLAEAYKSEPVVIIEVVEAAEDSVATGYLVDCAAEIKWQVGWDGEGALLRGYPGTSMPRTYLIGPDGKVAWHAHIAALTKPIVDAQITRCGFSDVKSVPTEARQAAKAMLDLRFGEAIVFADKVFTDSHASAEAKAYCAKVKKEISRYWTFQRGVVDALIKDLDWAVAYHRVERMLVTYKGTDHFAEVQKLKDELDANPRVKYIVEAQEFLDHLVEAVPREDIKGLERLIEKLKAFQERYPDTSPEKKAGEWIAECERRIARRKAK
jgi:hypothetical protein